MRAANKRLLDNYESMFENLSPVNKLELIERISKSLKADFTHKKDKFYKAFGAFGSSKPEEEIIEEIRKSRSKNRKPVKF